MRTRSTVIHRETAREAGYGALSPLSVLAGVVSAYGAFAIVAAVVGAVMTSIDADTEFRTNDWTSSGAVAALASAVVLFLAYLFGGYVAGRMARRAGVLHGVVVFIVSLMVGAAAGGVVAALDDGGDVERNLRSIGIPTTADQVTDVAIAGAIVSLVAVLLGSVLGGMLGERWHTKLARRAADPDYGPGAAARAEAERADEERAALIERDETVRRDVEAEQIDLRDDDRTAVVASADDDDDLDDDEVDDDEVAERDVTSRR
jgi:hypothetical protein